MYTLIVLGLIPGTHIQITFLVWLIMSTLLVGSAALLYIKRKHLLAFVITVWQLHAQLTRFNGQLARD